jgi:uncharacterized membrane protein YphA (DoxX/SURF4 family)
MTSGWQKWLIMMLRLGFGLLLIVASIDKIRHPYPFADVVENYHVLGEGLSRWAAVWVPYLEAIVGVLLILGVWLDEAVLMSFFLMGVFFSMVTQAYLRGLDIRCGCFFVEGDSTIGLMKVGENLLFVCFSVLLLVLIRKRKSAVV